MLKQVQTLPGTKRKPTVEEWNGQAGVGERRPDMGGHVIETFRSVPEMLRRLRHQSLKEVAHVERDIRIGILLNDQRTGCVLHKRSEQAFTSG